MQHDEESPPQRGARYDELHRRGGERNHRLTGTRSTYTNGGFQALFTGEHVPRLGPRMGVHVYVGAWPENRDGGEEFVGLSLRHWRQGHLRHSHTTA